MNVNVERTIELQARAKHCHTEGERVGPNSQSVQVQWSLCLLRLNFVPDHDAEAVFAERLAVPLEERRVLERLVAALHPTRIRSESHIE